MLAVASKSASILIVDDHPLFRRAVRLVVESQPGWKVVGESANGRDAIAMVEELRPDIIVLDLSLPVLNGIDTLGPILQTSPGTRVLVLTMHESENLVEDAIRAGAAGYILKSDADEELVSAIGKLLDGRTHFSSPIVRTVYHRLCGEEKTDANTRLAAILSRRELEILCLLSEGNNNRQVAEQLHLSVRTVENHRARMMHKLGVRSFGDLLRLAMRAQLIQP